MLIACFPGCRAQDVVVGLRVKRHDNTKHDYYWNANPKKCGVVLHPVREVGKEQMFLLFGFKTVERALPSRLSNCRYCGVYAEQHLVERASKFTLFFIPVFTMSRTYFVTCSNCGQRSSLSKRGMKALAR